MKRILSTFVVSLLVISTVTPSAYADVSEDTLSGESNYKSEAINVTQAVEHVRSILIKPSRSFSSTSELSVNMKSWPALNSAIIDTFQVTKDIFRIDLSSEISAQDFLTYKNSLLVQRLAIAVEPNNTLTNGNPPQESDLDTQTVQGSAIWGLDRIDQRLLPLNGNYEYEQTASNVYAYVVDSGILSSHAEFAGRMEIGFQNVNDGRGTVDCDGHGTHVAGTIGSTTYGVAKSVRLVPVRVGNCSGGSTAAQLIEALNWIGNDVTSKGRKAVVNISMGGSYNSLINSAVEALIARGVPVVVASGNDAENACLVSPASAPNAITVNASTTDDYDATFSNFGSCTDIYAPGEGIMSTYIGSNTSVETLSGTSMASPHVAGVVALLLEKYPSYSPAQIWSHLQNTSTKADFLPEIPTDAKYLLYYGNAPQNQEPIRPDMDADLYLLGASIKYDETQLYEPTGCSVFYFNYVNRTRVDLLTLEMIIRSRWNDSIEYSSEIGIDHGTTGTWDSQICTWDLTDELGPYFITLKISDYAGNSRSITEELVFVPRPNSTRSIIPVVAVPEEPREITVFGTSSTWDQSDFYTPDGCSRYDVNYANNSGGRLLSLKVEMTSQFGDRIDSDSVIGILNGVYGVFHFFICDWDLDGVLGPYTMRLTAERYTSDGGGTFSTQTTLEFRNRPQYLTLTPTPVISGELKVGKLLTAQPGTWDSGVSLGYQWKRNGQNIDAANNSTYRLTESDYGKQISVTTTGSKQGFVSVSRTSNPSASIGLGQFSAITTPQIQGTAKVGETLFINPLSWDEGVVYSYQWRIDGVAVSGATNSTFTLPVDAWRKNVSVDVSGTKSFFESATRTSASIYASGRTFTITGKPKVVGNTKVGKTIRVDSSGWISTSDSSSGLSFSYQWFRAGKAIKGKTSSSLRLDKASANKKVSVRVTVNAVGYEPTTMTVSSKKVKS
ncbi:MAG: S8 family serine peptidase [Candidatus Nanopelagicales bacterium]